MLSIWPRSLLSRQPGPDRRGVPGSDPRRAGGGGLLTNHQGRPGSRTSGRQAILEGAGLEAFACQVTQPSDFMGAARRQIDSSGSEEDLPLASEKILQFRVANGDARPLRFPGSEQKPRACGLVWSKYYAKINRRQKERV